MKVFPSGLHEVHGVAAAGDVDTILELNPHAKEWGRECWAVRAVIENRGGWRCILPEYEVHQVTVRKEL